jgi:hypothetical protein
MITAGEIFWSMAFEGLLFWIVTLANLSLLIGIAVQITKLTRRADK